MGDEERELFNWKQIKMEIPDSHLHSPIRRRNREMLAIDDRSKIPRYIVKIREGCPIEPKELELDSEKMYGILLGSVYDSGVELNETLSENLSTCLDVTLEFLKSHLKSLYNKDILLPYAKLPIDLIRSYTVKQYWEKMRKMMQNKKNTRDQSWDEYPSIGVTIEKVWISQSYMIIQDIIGQYWLFDYDQVMLLSDTISSRVFTVLYFFLMRHTLNCKIEYSTIVTLYKHFDALLSERGNDAYLEIKNWEPIIQGLLLEAGDPLVYSHKFLRTIILELEQEKHVSALKMLEILRGYNLNVYQLGELHGIFRHWGHPTVDEVAGCQKIQKIAKNRPLPNFNKMMEMKALFIRQFCISFISMHGRWPRILLSRMKKGTSLYNLISRSQTHANFYSPNYPLKDWSTLIFQQEFEMDYHLDFTDVIDDKSLGVYLQDIPTIYSKEILGYTPKTPISSRRVLLEVMRRKEIDIKGVCQRIMKRDVPKEWKVILVHAKERELKMEPRLFAIQVLEMRLYFCITEMNLSHRIFPYFPQQTMTLSEGDLTRRLFSLSRAYDDKRYCPVYASIDFKSWNIHWQYLTTKPFFEVLDNLFGTPGLYTYTHIFFSESVIALASHHNPPPTLIGRSSGIGCVEEVTCDTLWTQHGGGFEGIRQKGWTLITICLLLYVEITTGVKGYIIGQGDNQVCKLMLPREDTDVDNGTYILMNQEYLTNTVTLYMEELDKAATYLSLVVKTEESWVSSTIVNYGKEILYRGAYLSQGAKRISRVFPDINELYPTLLSKIGTLQTTGMSTAQKSYDLWVPYIICQVETLLSIVAETEFSLMHGAAMSKEILHWVHKRETLVFLLHGDSNVMGLPIANPLNYLYRGHPDPLSAYTSFLHQNTSHCEICKGIYLILQHNIVTLGDGDPSLLISDPLSLNIDRAPQLSQLFKVYMTYALRDHTTNIALKSIFHKTCIEEDKAIFEYLIQSDPIHPRLLHEIATLTPVGSRLAILAKFSNTRTIQQLAQVYQTKGFYRKIKSNEVINLQHWKRWHEKINLVCKVPHDFPFLCPTLLAQQLRDYTWNKTLSGKKIEGVTIPYPAHQFKLNMCSSPLHNGCVGQSEHLMFKLLSDDCNEVIHTRGPQTPYLGSTTREKFTGKIIQIPEISRPLAAAQRLMQLHSWCVAPTTGLYGFILDIVQGRTNLPLDILRLSSGSITSGSVTHRLNDHITKRHTLHNMRPNVASWVYFSSDHMGKYSRGSENLNLHFQGAIHYGISVLGTLAVTSLTIPDCFIHLHFDCLECEEYLKDVKIKNTAERPNIRTNIENPLVYSHADHIPQWTNPDVPCFRLIKSTKLAEACAAILFSRIIKNIGSALWGTSERATIFGSSISIQDIIKADLEQVIKHLAMLIYLYYYDEKENISMYLTLFDHEIWKELSTACLLPEVLPELYSIAGNSYQSGLFDSHLGVVRLLNKALSLAILKIQKSMKHETIPPNVLFHLLPGCNISRVFLMWSNLILEVTKGNLDIRPICRKMSFELTAGLNLPSADSVYNLYQFIKNSDNPQGINICFRSHPLLLCKNPPESALGEASIVRPKKQYDRISLVTLRVSSLEGTSMPYLLDFPFNLRNRKPAPRTYPKSSSINVIKSYQDHMYGLVGDLSCALLKIYQILKVFNIDISTNIICLADGDGSITELLHRMTGKSIIFNTKVDPNSLIPQRGVNYTPGSMIHSPDKVIGGELSALLGGDLCNQSYLSALLSILPNDVCLITMDAESNREFSPKENLALVKSTLMVAVKSSAQCLIYKTYCNNPAVLSAVIGILNTVYKKISLTVPIFSSNETDEVYLVCSSFDPIVNLATIGDEMTVFGTSLIPDMAKLKRERYNHCPHQEQMPEVWKQLIKELLDKGYNWNLARYLEKIADYMSPYDDECSVPEWLNKIMKLCSTMCNDELRGMGKIMTGDTPSLRSRRILSKSRSMHRLVDRLSLVYLNCRAATSFINPTSSRVALDNVKKIYADGIQYTINGVPVYTYSHAYECLHPDIRKSLWKIRGCCIFKTEIGDRQICDR